MMLVNLPDWVANIVDIGCTIVKFIRQITSSSRNISSLLSTAFRIEIPAKDVCTPVDIATVAKDIASWAVLLQVKGALLPLIACRLFWCACKFDEDRKNNVSHNWGTLLDNFGITSRFRSVKPTKRDWFENLGHGNEMVSFADVVYDAVTFECS